MHSANYRSRGKSRGRSIRGFVPGLRAFILALLSCGLPALAVLPARAQSPQSSASQLRGSITGTIVDPTGTAVAAARVVLTTGDNSPAQDVLTGALGQFSFGNIAPGGFKLTVTADGFASQSVSGTLNPGDTFIVPPIALNVATLVTAVRVTPPLVEIAEAQIKDQEKQRVLGVVPNFYVTYISNAAPLSSKQKFELAWKSTLDPVTFGIVGAIAGLQQAQNQFSGYGQGVQGYADRYGATYADTAIGTFIGSAILPSVLKQDPRYFYKGTGSIRSRFFYAVGASVFCKGDNGRWQPNYSNIIGSLAAGGISNLYYPPQNRNGVGLTFESALIGIGATSGANVLQEFVIRKLTPSAKPPIEDPPHP